jgi:hypothetical protein
MASTRAVTRAPTANGRDSKARVRFRHPTGNDGLLDAGWWPRSCDLATELPPLLDVVWTAGGDIMHVSYALGFWDPIPRRLNIGGRVVQLSGFHTQLSGLLSLTSRSGRGRIDVMVIPPDTDSAVADRALEIVSDQPSPAHPSQVLDRARIEIAALPS